MKNKYTKPCLICGNDVPLYRTFCGKKCVQQGLYRQLNRENKEKLKEKNDNARKKAYFNR